MVKVIAWSAVGVEWLCLFGFLVTCRRKRRQE
jgi:hypothetical protein